MLRYLRNGLEKSLEMFKFEESKIGKSYLFFIFLSFQSIKFASKNSESLRWNVEISEFKKLEFCLLLVLKSWKL